MYNSMASVADIMKDIVYFYNTMQQEDTIVKESMIALAILVKEKNVPNEAEINPSLWAMKWKKNLLPMK